MASINWEKDISVEPLDSHHNFFDFHCVSKLPRAKAPWLSVALK